MKIRAATIADVPRMMEIERQSATAAHWTEQSYIDAITGTHPRRVVLVLEISDSDPFVQSTGGSTPRARAFSVAHCFESEWEIENIAVDQAFRRRGFASNLLQAILQQARSEGGTHVRLEVRESNAAARKLYERWGFRSSGRRRRYYRAPDEDALILEIFFDRDDSEIS